MTTALERVRKAISEGTAASFDDVRELASAMPIELDLAVFRLIAGVVATFHSNGGPGVEDWMGESVEEHLRHANDHAADAYCAADGDNPSDTSHNGERDCEDDGLRHVDHAACRIAMAFARERMTAEKKGSE